MTDRAPHPCAAGDTVLVVAPHPDDEILGCGGLLAGLPDPKRVYVFYAADGSGAATYDLPGVQPDPSVDIGAMRRAEARAALASLGVPADHAHFGGVPDFRVADQAEAVSRALGGVLAEQQPDCVLVPFRYDRHPDHIALCRIARGLLHADSRRPRMLEYFVYYRWRLLPGGDVRRRILDEHRVIVELSPEMAAAKRAALECYRSQVTRFFSWQTAPVLSAALLDEVCRGPEVFVQAPPNAPDADVIAGSLIGLRLVHRVEPFLKRHGERMKFRLRRWRRTS